MRAKQPARFFWALALSILGWTSSPAQKPELVVQTGHSSFVQTVAFSPDGRTLASCDFGRIKLWDVSTGNQLRTLSGYGSAFAFSPDGKIIASGGSENTIVLWDVITGDKVRSFIGSGYVSSLAFSPDGKRLVSSGSTAELKPGSNLVFNYFDRIWDVLTGKEMLTLAGSEGFNQVLFSVDGAVLVGGHLATPKVRIWSTLTGKPLGDLQTLPFPINRGGTLTVDNRQYSFQPLVGVASEIAFSPDSKTVASHEANTIHLRDVDTGREIRTLSGHSPSIFGFAVSPDGKTVATGVGGGAGENQGPIRLWNLGSDTQVRTLSGPGWFTSLAFSPDGKLLASGNDQWYGDIGLWDVSTGALLPVYQPYNAPTGFRLGFSPDGRILAAGSLDKTVRLLAVPSLAELRTLTGHSEPINSVAFSPDGKIVGSVSNKGTIKLWDASTGSELYFPAGNLDEFNNRIVFSPDGNILATGNATTVRLWNVASGALLHTLTCPAGELAFSSNGKVLVAYGYEGVRLWNVSNGIELNGLAAGTSVFNSTHDLLISSSPESGLDIWSLRSREKLASLVPFADRDWLVVTPQGLFDGSSDAWNQLLWRFNNNTFDHVPVEAFYNEFYYPGVLTDIFAGKSPKAPSNISQKDRRSLPLKLKLVGSHPNLTSTSRNVGVQIDVSDVPADKDHKTSSGAQDVRLFRNGSLVKVWRGDVLRGKNSVTFETTIPIVAGENRLTAYAFNHDNIKSTDASLTVTGEDSLKRKGVAYVLAIGVNQYANSQYNLKYAFADAQDFAGELKIQQAKLGNFERVEVISLSDREATKANILKALTDLSTKIQPEDALVIYFAGHGTAQQNRFYLIPHDLGYMGSRTQLNRAGLRTILAHSISDEELQRAVDSIDAGQMLLVIDACNSGQALEAEEKRRGPMNSKGLAQLAYEKGMYILTAAQSYQAANEAERYGHGFLTYALVEEGLKTGAADKEPKDGQVLLREWLDFATQRVPQMQQDELDEQKKQGRQLDRIKFAETDSGADRSIQRPRVFYRRETEPHPLVVARP